MDTTIGLDMACSGDAHARLTGCRWFAPVIQCFRTGRALPRRMWGATPFAESPTAEDRPPLLACGFLPVKSGDSSIA
jgi:hypothetical protein